MRGSGNKFALRLALVGAGLAGCLTLGSAPASAQFFGYWGAPPVVREALPPSLIYRHLRERGFRIFNRLQRNGGVYLADVIDRRGRRSRLVVDAYSGAILQSFVYGPPRPQGYIPDVPRGYATGPRYASRYPPSYGPAPTPPRPIPIAPRAHRPAAKAVHLLPKLARRETPPVAPSVAPKAAASPPIGRASLAPAAGAPKGSAASAAAPSVKKTHRRPRALAQSAPPAPAATPAAPKPATVANKTKPINKPGYAHGVPINPLD